MTSKRIELGDLARDTVTKFEGVVIVEMRWLHGCRRLGIQPVKLTKDGKPADYQSFDEGQLTLVRKAVAPTTAPATAPVEPRAGFFPRLAGLFPADRAATGGPGLGRNPERR